MNNQKIESEKEFYQKGIIDMVKEMENITILKLLFYFTKSGYKEEKAGWT